MSLRRELDAIVGQHLKMLVQRSAPPGQGVLQPSNRDNITAYNHTTTHGSHSANDLGNAKTNLNLQTMQSLEPQQPSGIPNPGTATRLSTLQEEPGSNQKADVIKMQQQGQVRSNSSSGRQNNASTAPVPATNLQLPAGGRVTPSLLRTQLTIESNSLLYSKI